MVDVFVGIVRGALKGVVLLLACAFWFVFGFLIWTRVVVFSFAIYAAQIMLSPFGRGSDAAPSQNFDKALGLWGRGFERIFRSLRTSSESDEDIWEGDGASGCWAALGNFVWQTIMTLLFWGPLLIAAHYSGLWEQRAIVAAQAYLGDALGLESQPPAATSQSPCLGLSAIEQLEPQIYSTNRDVNVRQGPGTNHTILQRLQGGQHVTVTGKSPGGRWLLIEIDNEMLCFVSADYLQPE